MLKEGRDGRDASIKRIVSAQRPVSGLPGRECAPLDLPFLFLRNCKQPSYYSKFPASLQGAPSSPFARGLRPLCAPNARRGCAPSSALLPMGRALRPSTPGDFPAAGKVTKGAPRAAPFGIPRCVVTALFALAAHRAGLPSATNPDRFATLNLWVNRPLFLPKLHRRSHPLFSIRGSAGGEPPRMLEGLSYREQYR